MKKIHPSHIGALRLHHGTAEHFDEFDLNFAQRPGMSANGHLGIWLAVDKEVAHYFGPVCLDVSVEVENPYVMDIGELKSLNQQAGLLTQDFDEETIIRNTERDFYAKYRESLMGKGHDIIYVQELDGLVAMAVGLAPEKLTIEADVAKKKLRP